jgi:hypothetical protein
VADSKIKRAARLFLHPSSLAACYRNPYPLVTGLVARVLNLTLRVRNRLAPARSVVCTICGWAGWRFGYSSAASVKAPSTCSAHKRAGHALRRLSRQRRFDSRMACSPPNSIRSHVRTTPQVLQTWQSTQTGSTHSVSTTPLPLSAISL